MEEIIEIRVRVVCPFCEDGGWLCDVRSLQRRWDGEEMGQSGGFQAVNKG